MTESYVNAKIRRVKQDPRYTVLPQLQRQPRSAREEQPEQPSAGGDPDPAAAEAAPQPSTSQGIPPPPSQPAGPSPKGEAVDSAGKKVLAATYVSATEVDGKHPPYNKSLETVDLDFNRNYGYDNMARIIRMIDYGALNRGWAPLVTQQRGSCLFHSVRRSIQCPKEFTNMHLRRMIVSFICDRVDELFPMLKVAISGNYGHLRLTQDEYQRKMDEGTVTDQEKEEYEEPGPFSIASYLESLLKPSFYGEEICLRIISMMFKVRISVLDGDSLLAIKVRHSNVALKADFVLVHVKRCHLH